MGIEVPRPLIPSSLTIHVDPSPPIKEEPKSSSLPSNQEIPKVPGALEPHLPPERQSMPVVPRTPQTGRRSTILVPRTPDHLLSAQIAAIHSNTATKIASNDRQLAKPSPKTGERGLHTSRSPERRLRQESQYITHINLGDFLAQAGVGFGVEFLRYLDQMEARGWRLDTVARIEKYEFLKIGLSNKEAAKLIIFFCGFDPGRDMTWVGL